MDNINEIKKYFERENQIISKLNWQEINAAINAIKEAWHQGTTIYTIGNGGSGATASHMVCDFNKGVSMATGKKFHMICLNDNVPSILAIANDISYDDIYAVQLKDTVKNGDLIIAFSGSGNSANVLKGVEYAKSQGAQIVAMTGYDGGKLYKMADYHLHVPVNDMQITEDLHMIFVHMMMQILSERGR